MAILQSITCRLTASCWLRALLPAIQIVMSSDAFTTMSSKSSSENMMTSSSKYIIDTDPGVDDAQGIALALTNLATPDGSIPNILGFTLVGGNAPLDQAARNIYRVLKLMNRTDIPVFLGAHRPISGELPNDHFFGMDGFGDVPEMEPKISTFDSGTHTAKFGNAISSIITLANQYPGEITLICLGPLTNIALAYLLEPRLPNLLKKTVLLGGNMYATGNIKPAAEFNFYTDPHAAAIVVDNMKPLILPYETILRYELSWDWYNAWTSVDTQIGTFLSAIEGFAANNSKSKGYQYMFSDQAAVAIALHSKLITRTERRPAKVEVFGEHTKGQLVVDMRSPKSADKNSGNIELVMEYDINKVKDLFWKLLRLS